MYWLRWLFVAVPGLSLIESSGDYSPIVTRGLLTAVASLAAEHGLEGVGSGVVAHRLSCCRTCGIFLDQESNSCPLHWKVNS